MVFTVEHPQVDQDEVVGYIAIQKGSATLQDSTTGEQTESWGIFVRRNRPVFEPHLPAASKGMPNGSFWPGVNSPLTI